MYASLHRPPASLTRRNLAPALLDLIRSVVGFIYGRAELAGHTHQQEMSSLTADDLRPCGRLYLCRYILIFSQRLVRVSRSASKLTSSMSKSTLRAFGWLCPCSTSSAAPFRVFFIFGVGSLTSRVDRGVAFLAAGVSTCRRFGCGVGSVVIGLLRLFGRSLVGFSALETAAISSLMVWGLGVEEVRLCTSLSLLGGRDLATASSVLTKSEASPEGRVGCVV